MSTRLDPFFSIPTPSLTSQLFPSHISFIVRPITHIFSTPSPVRRRAVTGCWAPALWLTNVECVVGGKHPVKRWREASTIPRFLLVTTRSWTSHPEPHSSTSPRDERALTTWVSWVAHAHIRFRVSWIMLAYSSSKSEILARIVQIWEWDLARDRVCAGFDWDLRFLWPHRL